MTEAAQPPGSAFAGLLDDTLGIEVLDRNEEVAHARLVVTDAVRQPMGIVHGGVYAAIAETVASMTTYEFVAPEGNIAVGQSNSTSFLRPISEGTVHAVARRRHRGRTSWIWDVDMSDDQGRLCATSRITMAVRPIPS